ncbi:hypothetical protein [Tardiphaga sp. 839_C3_N1_4]|uniref:hypothetical protein n=1 Tax=Tardiphaga sp. 839_C3_N1_4 TaxID=3240761 RepID=UPI003F27EF65
MFDIRNSVDYYGKMIEDYDDFAEQSRSTRHAINSATSLYHLHEWIWGDWLKDDEVTREKMGSVRRLGEFKVWLDQSEGWFPVVQGLTNGSKHFIPRGLRTRSTGTYAEPGYVEPGYQQMLLEIETEPGQWLEAIIVLEKVVMFWQSFFATYRLLRSYDSQGRVLRLCQTS